MLFVNKGHLKELQKFHIEILKNILSSSTRAATPIVYILLGTLPLKAEIERRQLGLFIRNTSTLIQVIVACRKLVPDVLPNNTEILNIIESKSRILCYKLHLKLLFFVLYHLYQLQHGISLDVQGLH